MGNGNVSEQLKIKPSGWIWLIRLLISVVAFWNFQCAFRFYFSPYGFVSSFDLPVDSGPMVIRSLGLLFAMWTVPYGFAILRPIQWRVCLWAAVIQQALGVIGESWLLTTIPTDLVQTHSSIIRFIWFDAAGLVLLLLALFISMFLQRKA